ncbi:phage tail tape measure protein [Lysobacter fragariae]
MASRSLGSLFIDLLMNTGRFETDAGRAARVAQKRAKEIEKAFVGSFKTIGAGLAGFAAGFLSVNAVFDGLKGAIDFADKLNDFNQRLGVSAETLSGWAYTARQTGTDIDALGIGLKKLAKNMAEALDPKSQQAGLFKALGVDVKDAEGNLRSLEDLLPEIADGFKKLNNETLEAALAQELFGKSGTDLLEFLNQGGDGLQKMQDRARELGIELSQGTLSAADEFNDKLSDLKATAEAFFLQLAAELLPVLTDLVEKFTEITKEGNESGGIIKWIGDQAKATEKDFQFFADSIQDVKDLFGGLYESAKSAFGMISAIGRIDISGIGKSLDSFKESAARVRGALTGETQNAKRGQETIDPWANVTSGGGKLLQGRDLLLVQARMKRQAEAEQKLLDFLSGKGESAKSGTAKHSSGKKSEAEQEVERLQKAYESLKGSQQEQIALFGKTGEAAKVRYDLEHGELSKLSEEKKADLLAGAERLDQLAKEAEATKKLEETKERVGNVLKDIQSEIDLLGKSAEYQDTYNKLKYAGVDANSAFGQSIIEANHQLHEQAKAVGDQISLMDDFRSGASDALVEFVTGAKSAKEALSDFFDDMAAKITRMIAERWIEQLFGQQGTTGGGTSGGGWLSALFGAFSSGGGSGGGGGAAASGGASGGGWFTSLLGAIFGGGRANGGPVLGGKFYEVNEGGWPEMLQVRNRQLLMMPAGTNGVVRPMRNGGAGGISQTNHFHYAAPYDARTESQKNARLAFETQRAASRNR